jgi:hypothetical protein
MCYVRELDKAEVATSFLLRNSVHVLKFDIDKRPPKAYS